MSTGSTKDKNPWNLAKTKESAPKVKTNNAAKSKGIENYESSSDEEIESQAISKLIIIYLIFLCLETHK